MPSFDPGDFSQIAQPLDFVGLNIYTSDNMRVDANGNLSPSIDVQTPRTRFDWPITPEALYWGPRHFYDRYQLPIYITENGVSSMDWVTLDENVPDTMRIDFTRRYLCQLRKAVSDGVDVRGYFHWSLMDNFEWADGYKQRFGLIYVDFKTQERILKESAHWYSEVIRSNGANL
jgi:beta-glucosidase